MTIAELKEHPWMRMGGLNAEEAQNKMESRIVFMGVILDGTIHADFEEEIRNNPYLFALSHSSPDA